MINFLSSVEPEAKVSVKRIKTVIHPGQSTTISCKSQAGVVETKAPLLFAADPVHIPNDLSIADTMVVANKGANNYFQIPVTNTSSTDITIKKNEVIRKLQLVSPIVPLPVKQLNSIDSESHAN